MMHKFFYDNVIDWKSCVKGKIRRRWTLIQRWLGGSIPSCCKKGKHLTSEPKKINAISQKQNWTLEGALNQRKLVKKKCGGKIWNIKNLKKMNKSFFPLFTLMFPKDPLWLWPWSTSRFSQLLSLLLFLIVLLTDRPAQSFPHSHISLLPSIDSRQGSWIGLILHPVHMKMKKMTLKIVSL